MKFEFVPAVTYACFVLHIFCENQKNCGTYEEEVQDQIVRHKANKDDRIDQLYKYIRRVLINYIQQNLPEHGHKELAYIVRFI